MPANAALQGADLNLADARRKRNLNEFNQLPRERRTDVYGEVPGAAAKPGWYRAHRDADFNLETAVNRSFQV